MKRVISLILIITLFQGFTQVFSQISQGGTPISFKNDLKSNIDNVFVNPPDMEKIRKENQYYDKTGEMWRVSELIDVEFNMNNSGSWDELKDGTKIWRLRITSEDAKALSLHYNDFYLPEGSKLFLYNENKKQVAGAFTSFNNPKDDNYYSTRIIEGETTTLEYIEPAWVSESPVISIYRISYFYRGVVGLIGHYKDSRQTSFGSSGACEINVNCPEGNNWQDEKRGVALIYIPSGMGGGFCTGSLVNNTNQDGTPYFLTADHCGGDQSNQDQWEFYFNYESANCANPGTEPSHDDIIGATKKSLGDDNGGTDFLLLELLNSPPSAYDVYYNGWDRSTTGASESVGIHHPSGDIMKISEGGGLTTSSYTGAMANAHWEVTWQQTGTGEWGVTEGGSSGSPIFDESSKLIVGTLTGGGASCSNQSAPDYYGKFDLHWVSNGATDADQLEPWLDPAGTDPTTLQGWDPNSTPGSLTADFTASQTNIAPGSSINFTDQTAGGTPTSWNWQFDGANPNTSTNPNPTNINYPTAGVYSVTLTVDDGTNTDQEVKTDYITVQQQTGLNANFTPSQTNINPGDCIYFQDQSSGGPVSWDWTFNGGNPSSSTLQNPVDICYDTPGTYDVSLTISDGSGGQDTYNCAGCIVVNDPANQPAALFTADNTTIPEGGIVNFTDTSINGPFVTWAWDFESGNPSTSTDSQPSPVVYQNAGTYDVELRIEDSVGNQYVNLKEDYINVVPDADDKPEADFIANYTVIQPGESVNFHDISTNNPYEWEWIFESGQNNTSTDQHPNNITYPAQGEFDVQLIAKNSEGRDTILKEDYIVVSDVDPCTESPIANFTATNRMLTAGETTYFQDLSTGYPTSHFWDFGQDAIPSSSNNASPIDGIEYNVPGIYDVSLTLNNDCGNDVLTKEDYIFVFSGPVPKYCDTMTNLGNSEIPKSISVGSWGNLAGHNSERVRAYADYFESYSFTTIEGLIVPVNNALNGLYNSYVTFYVWSDKGGMPTDSTILGEKKVYLRNIPENFNSVIEFDNPIEIDGPFYIGFSISYPDNDDNGISDDKFVVSVAPSRGTSESNNTMYVYKNNEWKSSVQVFNIATSMAIKPIACLVKIDELDVYSNIHTYPNPTSGHITLELGDEYRDKEIEIRAYDLTGRLLDIDKKQYTNTEYSLDFSGKSPGMYYLNIFIDGNKVNKKVSVVR